MENGPEALTALRTNIAVVALGGTVVNSSVQNFLKRAEENFDLVFMDPPWPLSRPEMEADLEGVDRLVDARAEIIISRRYADEVPAAPNSWRVATNRRYGDTRIVRYEKEGEHK